MEMLSRLQCRCSGCGCYYYYSECIISILVMACVFFFVSSTNTSQFNWELIFFHCSSPQVENSFGFIISQWFFKSHQDVQVRYLRVGAAAAAVSFYFIFTLWERNNNRTRMVHVIWSWLIYAHWCFGILYIELHKFIVSIYCVNAARRTRDETIQTSLHFTIFHRLLKFSWGITQYAFHVICGLFLKRITECHRI